MQELFISLLGDFYKLIDTFMPKGIFRFEAISYHYPLEDKHNYLNSNHKLWRNPTSYNMTSTESFVDLYLKSIKTAKVLICASFDYINNKDIDLDKIFENGATTNFGLSMDPTISAENWGAMLLGAEPIVHGLTNSKLSHNDHKNELLPSLFKRIYNAIPDAKLYSYCNWNPINIGLIEKDIPVEKYTNGNDKELTDEIIKIIKGE